MTERERDRTKGSNGAHVPTVRHSTAYKPPEKNKARVAAKAALTVLFFLCVYALLVSSLFLGRVYLKIGDVAKHSIKSPVNVEYVDKEKTNQKVEEEVKRRVERIYNIDPKVRADFNQEISLLYELVVDAADPAKVSEAVKEAGKRGYSEDVIEHVRKMTREEVDQRIRFPGMDYMRDLEDQGLRFPSSENEETALEQAIRERADREGLIGPPRLVFTDVVRKVINANKTHNAEKEQQQIRQIQAETSVVRGKLQKGELIVSDGEPVTQLVADKLDAAGLLHTSSKIFFKLVGLFLFELIFLLGAFFYIRRFHKKLIEDDITLGIWGLIVLFVLVVTKLLGDINSPSTSYLIAFPALTGGFLIWLLVDRELSLKAAGGLLLFMGAGYSIPIEPAFAAFAACVVGFTMLPDDWGRLDLLRAGLWASLINMGLAAVFGIHAAEQADRVFWTAVYASLAGIGASAASLGLFLPFFESLFRITTSSKLLELSSTDAPVLRWLMVDAPGTYQHSLMVGNLAQSAAEELGADALLARVSSYYHDVGKLRRPNFFTENQVSGQNPHDELSPSLSVLIITSHIKDGIEIARHHRLPEEIIDIIAQHHGTTTMLPFFEKARQLAGSVLEDDFRYGPPSRKPQSLEAAIVMLADCVESAMRSQEKPTSIKMAQIVDKIVQSRLADGQFDDCHLTLKEIERIKSSFLRTLESIYHNRLEYPGAAESAARKPQEKK